MDDGWGVWLVMVLMTLVFWGVVAVLVVSVMRRGPGSSRWPDVDPDPPEPALRILDERLARGEIDLDEYSRRRDALLGR